MDLADFHLTLPRRDLWVFGYGSLMWSPGFRYREKSIALLKGYHRALCILSTRYRGTTQSPGLVVGLCRGGSCWGMAFRVPARSVLQTLEQLWHREMLRRVYVPRLVPVTTGSGRRVRALAFAADPAHPQFVRELGLHERARLVAQGVGERGPCVEYIVNTLTHMGEIGVHDRHLERILETARTLCATTPAARPVRK